MAQRAMKGRDVLTLDFPNTSPEGLGGVVHKELEMWTKIRLQTGERDGQGEKDEE